MTEPVDTAPAWYTTWVEPYLNDSALWPIVFAVAGHVMVLIVPVALIVFRTGNIGAGIVLAIMVVASLRLAAFEWQHRGGPRGMTLVLVLTWLASAGMIALALETNFL